MRVVIVSIGVFLLTSSAVLSQKVMMRSWDASAINSLRLTTDMAYSIDIKTAKVAEISLRARVEGETFEHVLINQQVEAGVLTIHTSYTPYFERLDDKLAAHKVMGLDITLIIPEGMVVEIRSSLASLSAQGAYMELTANLEDGNCTLQRFTGNALLKTRGGFIRVMAGSGVAAIAKSKQGEVINKLNTTGNYLVRAESVTGNIKLLPTQ